MNYRKAKINEIEEINKMYEEGSFILKSRGIDQWQGKNLPKASMENINSIYVLEDDGEIIATALHLDYDSDYDEIFDGEWICDGGEYYAIHRFMTKHNVRNKGYAKLLLEEIEILAKRNNKDSIRLDTHKDNIPMQKTLEKMNYEKCGVVYLYNGAPRLAYEKLVK